MPINQVLRRGTLPRRPLRIVCIGGGTGLSTLLQGLKYYADPGLGPPPERPDFLIPPDLPVELTAVVTVTDDGGSSGRLRREFDVLPPGDIRNCMVALSEDEALLARLFNYRFAAGRGLKGHSFGNLFLTALTQLTGDFAHAIKLSSEVLAITGRIFPSTATNVALEAKLQDGTMVSGETKIVKSKSPIETILLKPRKVKPLPETLRAIEDADLISFGPGSLFTSVIPNLLVEGIPQAIRRSPAVKAYFCNLMWQPGETMHFRASDHVRAIHDHAKGRLLEFAIVNSTPIAAPQRRRYALAEAKPVDVDAAELERMGLRIVSEELLAGGAKVRHDPHRSAALVMRLALANWKLRQKADAMRPAATSG